ncbi:MAG: hypothetical protein DRP71_01260 [Verrucomicrobia bacterium]|nr:MAG: hypothetical protein DRP71_01260 [Verrucomicrobiota bacterium]
MMVPDFLDRINPTSLEELRRAQQDLQDEVDQTGGIRFGSHLFLNLKANVSKKPQRTQRAQRKEG